jgi:uncharacterized protein (TIGR03437 family)
LLPLITAFSSGFIAPTGWPSPIEASIVDDCGQPFVNGTVVATFTNGDAPLPLSSLQDGTWAGTWAPRKAVSSVTVTVAAQASMPSSLKGSVQVTGQLNANAEPPTLNTGGIVNSASYAGGAPAPGTLIAIFGSSLAASSAPATALPLPTTLAGSQVIIGGLTMPLLYAGPGQINAMVPFSAPVNATQQVLVQSGATLSVPENLTVAPGAPGTYTRDGSGSGQAIVFAINPDGSGYVVTTAEPAHPGQIIVIYCTGLGSVQSSISAGEATPYTPLAPVSESVGVMVGSSTAQVLYAGLVPTLSGLYQINATIPQPVMTGDSVPLILSTSGISTGTSVTIAIH